MPKARVAGRFDGRCRPRQRPPCSESLGRRELSVCDASAKHVHVYCTLVVFRKQNIIPQQCYEWYLHRLCPHSLVWDSDNAILRYEHAQANGNRSFNPMYTLPM